MENNSDYISPGVKKWLEKQEAIRQDPEVAAAIERTSLEDIAKGRITSEDGTTHPCNAGSKLFGIHSRWMAIKTKINRTENITPQEIYTTLNDFLPRVKARLKRKSDADAETKRMDQDLHKEVNINADRYQKMLGQNEVVETEQPNIDFSEINSQLNSLETAVNQLAQRPVYDPEQLKTGIAEELKQYTTDLIDRLSQNISNESERERNELKEYINTALADVFNGINEYFDNLLKESETKQEQRNTNEFDRVSDSLYETLEESEQKHEQDYAGLMQKIKEIAENNNPEQLKEYIEELKRNLDGNLNDKLILYLDSVNSKLDYLKDMLDKQKPIEQSEEDIPADYNADKKTQSENPQISKENQAPEQIRQDLKKALEQLKEDYQEEVPKQSKDYQDIPKEENIPQEYQETPDQQTQPNQPQDDSPRLEDEQQPVGNRAERPPLEPAPSVEIDEQGIDAFYKASTKAERLILGRDRLLRESYLRAEEGLVSEDGKEVDLSKLKQYDEKREFENRAVGCIATLAKQIYGDYNDMFVESDLMTSLVGFDRTFFRQMIDRLGENLTFDNYYKNVTEASKETRERILRIPTLCLDEPHREQVVEYTKTEGRVNPEALSAQDMAELLKAFKEYKEIPTRAIKDRPYFIQQRNAA